MKTLACLFVLALSAASAGGEPLKLEPFHGQDVTISFPKGWKVEQQSGVYVAQQDPAKKDSAGVMFVFTPNTNNATEDQILDGMVGQVAKNLKVTKRGAIDGGIGHFMIADGDADGYKVRLGALAIVANGKIIVSVFIAKTADFDKLGGFDLATAVLGSLKPNAPAATAAAPASSGGKLTAPPPDHVLKVSELAGVWTQDDHVMSTYVSASTGTYAGYSAIATAEKWTIDAKGNLSSKFTGTSSSNSGTYQVNENTTGVVTIDGDVLTVTKKKGQGATSHFFIRGWEVRPDISVLKLNGPYYDKGVENIERLRSDPNYAFNLDAYWVRIKK